MTDQPLDLLITNGKVVTPQGVRQLEIGIREGKVVLLVSTNELPAARRTIDASGKHILPGLVDPENHLGTHRPLKDSFSSETRAAAAGGLTTWGTMQASPKLRRDYIDRPRPEDVVPFSQVMPEFIEMVESHSFIDIFLTGFITTDAQALDIPRVAQEFGVTSFKYYLHMMQGPRTYGSWAGREKGGWLGFDDGTIYLGMEKTAEIGPPGIVCIHPENYEIVRLFEERLKQAERTDMAAWDERSPHFCEAGHVRTYAYYAGVTGCPLGGVTELAVRVTLEKFGISPKEVTLIQAGPDAQRIAALQSGKVAATVIAPPGLFAAVARGLKLLADLTDLGIKYPTSVFFVTRSYLRQNRATVKKFLMALTEGLHLYAHKRDFSIEVMRKYTNLSDPEVLSKSQDYFAKNTLLVPLTDPTGLKNGFPMDKSTTRKLEDFYDNSVLQELVSEGFVEKIAKVYK